MDRFAYAGIDVAHRVQLPYMIFNPGLLLDIDSPPLILPPALSGIDTHVDSLLQRCLHPYYRFRMRLAMLRGAQAVNDMRTKHKLPPLLHRGDAIDGRMVVSQTFFGLDYARPVAPLFPVVGLVEPRHHIPSLPSDLQAWLDGADAVVAVSVDEGAAVSRNVVDIVRAGLRGAGGVSVLWVDSGEGGLVSCDPASNEEFRVSGLPLWPALQHGAVQAAVSLCDATEALEVVSARLPLLCLPHGAVRNEVSLRLKSMGVAASVPLSAVAAEDVRGAVAWMFDNRTALRRDLDHWGDVMQTFGGVRRAADLAEEVLELGTDDLVIAEIDMPWYRLALIDVYAIYGAVLCGVAVILRTCWSATCAGWRKIQRKMKVD